MATAAPKTIVLENSRTVTAYIKDRQENPPNVISFKSVPVFSDYVGGVGEEEAILLVSSTGASKTKLSIRLYILDVVAYIREHREYDIEIVFVSLELSSIDIYLNIFAALLHERTGKEYSPQYFHNKDKKNKLSEDTLKEIEEIRDELDYIDSKLKVVDNIYTPSEIFFFLKTEVFNKNGTFVQGKYIKKNPNKNVIVIVDTINALSADKGKSEYDSIKYWSEYYTKKVLKKQYRAAIVNIQQTDKQSSKAQYTNQGSAIEDKFTPKLENLAKCKTTPDDHTLVISIYNPSNYEVPEYMGYNIEILKNSFRYLKILKSSFVDIGKGRGIHIDNANLQVEELPKASDKVAITQFFQRKKLTLPVSNG